MADTLRTLHLNDQHGWRGGEQQVLALTEGLAARGHHVRLVAQPGSELATRARAAGVDLSEVRTRGELSPRGVLRIRRLIREFQPHVVHCHTSHSHMHGLLACLGNAAPKLVVSRRVDFGIHKLPLRVALWKYRTRVDRYIAISEGVRRVLVQDGVAAERIGVVLSGLDPRRSENLKVVDVRAEFGVPASGPIICTVAALVGHKGHRFLVDAVPAIRKVHPDVRFLFVGAGELEDTLRRQAADRGVSDAILFTGFRTEFLALTAAADVYVMPSHLEGLNTSVIDAMFLTRPIVATNAGGLPELIRDGDTGWSVPKEDPDALAVAVIDALSHPDQARARGEAARAWALEHVTAECMVQGTVREYHRLLDGDV